MLKKSITYDDLNGIEVTDDFYFSFTQLELLELDLEVGGIEDVIRELSATTDGKRAYKLFKDVILAAYGEKSDDGRRFMKVDPQGNPLKYNFEGSPALSVMIIEFLQDPNLGAEFLRGTLPSKEAAKLVEYEATHPVPVVEVSEPKKKYKDYSKAELLEMSDDQFLNLVGSNPLKMNKDQLLIAMERKNKE